MPLLVHCPNNCQIRVPANRMGKVIRCSQCKSPIKIPQVDSPLLATGNWVECRAKRAIKKAKANDADALGPVSSSTVDGPTDDVSLSPPANKAPLIRAKPWRTVEALTSIDPEETPISIDINPQVENLSAESREKFVDEAAVSALQFDDEKQSEIGNIQIGKTSAAIEKPPIIVLDPKPAEAASETKSWPQRLADANADRKVLTQFLAFCLFLIAIVNVIPSINHFQSWWTLEETMPVPRWIYLQFFAGCVFLIYSVFLLQVQDWSALRGVSIAMLVIAFLFGAASTALLVADDGWIAGVLGIPYALSQSASIWCVIIVCLTTMISFWAGKESINWQRAERMLHEIMESAER